MGLAFRRPTSKFTVYSVGTSDAPPLFALTHLSAAQDRREETGAPVFDAGIKLMA